MISPCPHDALFGGVQRSAALAWEKIKGNGVLICYGTSCKAAKERTPAGQCCHPSKLGTVVASLRYVRRVRTLLIWHLGLLKLAPLFWLQKTRIFVYLHGVECWKPVDPMTDLLLRRVDMFLTNSGFTWDRFIECNPRWRCRPQRTVPLGMDVIDEAPCLPSTPPAALITGRMTSREDYKGHRQLISAWPAVLERIPEAELWIVGGGDLRPELEGFSRQLLPRGYVRFFGVVSEEEKLRLLKQCTCLAMPSRGEGFGLVYLEAMRVGRPCLVSSCDAGREVVNPPEAGLAADPDNASALVDTLTSLLRRDGQWQVWSAQARRRFELLFTKEAFHQRLFEALNS